MPTAAEIPAENRKRRRRTAAAETILDKRALVIGLVSAVAFAAGALVWRMGGVGDKLKKLEEFQFSVADVKPEEMKLKDPVRDIIKERQEEMKPEEVLKEERPNIQMTTDPNPVENTQEIVKSKNVDITSPKIDVTATNVEVQEAPVEITQVSETVTVALNTIAADSLKPADIFKYKEPRPSDLPMVHHISMAPRPGKHLTALPKQFGEQEVKASGQLGPMDINLFGTGDFMRTMDRSGGIKARTAVDAALHWLAIHQEADGGWKAERYEGEASASLAVTALSCLAFMGGGHNTRRGEYRRNVIKGLDYILRHQDANGRFWSESRENLYTHAICTIAVCEAFGRAHDENLQSASQRAIDFSAKAVNTSGGWRYEPNSASTDTSVTAWFIQAFKTAKLAQVKFESRVFSQALNYLDSVTNEGGAQHSNGEVYYENQQTVTHLGVMTSASMVIRQFNGMGVSSHLLVKGANIVRRFAPTWPQKDFYYWYYATYAMHNMGGEHRIWWNRKIRDVLLEFQTRTGEHAGSWDPKGDRWGKAAGRVYTTALGALCLEVYYRYSEALNSFGAAPELDELFFQGLQ